MPVPGTGVLVTEHHGNCKQSGATDGGRRGVVDGEVELARSNGGTYRTRAVPGAKIWHFEKMYTQESFFVRLVSSNVS